MRKRNKRILIFSLAIFSIIFLVIPVTIISFRNVIAKSYLENNLSKLAKAEITLDEIHIGSENITISKLKVKDNNALYDVSVDYLDAALNYSSLFSSGEDRFSNIVDSLYVSKPKIDFSKKFVGKQSDDKKEKSAKFDITKYARTAFIEGASADVEISFKEYFYLAQKAHDLDLVYNRDADKQVTTVIKDANDNTLQVDVSLNSEGMEEILMNANSFTPDSLYIYKLDNIVTTISGKTIYKQLKTLDDTLNYLAFDNTIDLLSFTSYGMDAKINDLKVSGSSNELFFEGDNVTFMDIPAQVSGRLFDMFNDQYIDAKAKIDDYDLNKRINNIFSNINATLTVQGKVTKPDLSATLNTKTLTTNGFKIDNIDADVSYIDNSIQVELLNSEYNGNIFKGKASYIDDILKADLVVGNSSDSYLKINGKLEAQGLLLNKSPFFRLDINDAIVTYNDINTPLINGYLLLKDKSVYSNLTSNNLSLVANGNILDNSYNFKIDLEDFSPLQIFNSDNVFLNNASPLINGSIAGSYNNNRLSSNLDIIATAYNDDLFIPLKTNFSWDIKNKNFDIENEVIEAKIFNTHTNAVGKLSFANGNILNIDLNINDNIRFKGHDLLHDKRGLLVNLDKVNLREIKQLLAEDIASALPVGFCTAQMDYCYSSPEISGNINLTGVKFKNFVGMGLKVDFQGTKDNINISSLKFYNERQVLLEANGIASLTNGYKLTLDSNLSNLDLSDYNYLVPIKGYINGDLSFIYDSNNLDQSGLRFNGLGSNINFADFEIQDSHLNVLINPRNIRVDNLYVNSHGFAELTAFGDLSYNLLSGEFIPSNKRFYLNLNTQAYQILHKLSPETFPEGDFSIDSELIVSIGENGLIYEEGYIKSNKGFLKVKGQPERFNNLALSASIKNNLLNIEQLQAQIGSGYLVINNDTSNENDNFFIGELVLGQFKINTSERGVVINIPVYMPEDETGTVNISGRTTQSAIIKGPFDDLKIEAEVKISNASCIYPPDTQDLLALITSISKKTFSRKRSSSSSSFRALAFTLDSKLIIGENVNYVTYPANIEVTPGSYLVLTHDKEWSVPNAYFSAEGGYVDFLGNQFNTEFVEVVINNIKFIISGNFSKRANDGSLVTLKISNDDTERNGIEALSLTLESDNPEDKTQIDALNRLRYGEDYGSLTQEQKTEFLQNETVLMLGSNMDNSVFNDFLKPLELFIRRRIYLDYFYIRPGFIKNMFNEYIVSDIGDQEEKVYESELEQFGSSILLNNLSVNFGREVYKRLFFNYTGLFQEATNLQNQSKMVYYQDLEFKYNFKFGTKVSYKYKLRPSDENSHEIMLYHSLNF